MKLYITNRKVNDTYEKAMTVFSNKGKLLYSNTGRILESDLQKFDKTLYAIEWGIKEFRKVAQNGELNETEPLILFISSKTIYNWLEKEMCPSNYIKTFSNIQMELSLLVNECEIIYSTSTKAIYKSTVDKTHNMKSIMKDFAHLED